ncbi:PAS domain-containing protein [Sphingosinicella rhizophila]|uniref:PAS domain-containing protein n=1 Tax=Sphingosinicella rhizophila TaxID=3050082 RepID=A0ABU3Q898_9SPHN|nr:hypothetical protein [Sphingosinicella sp. GR2756]MDT9599633.1 hypothetical protein [Sphingosinicella sp. GR2756]
MFNPGRIFSSLLPRKKQERRLHIRALLHWQAAAGGRDLVPLEGFDWLAFEDRSSHVFLLDLTDEAEPAFAYVGPVLRDEADVSGDDIRLDQVPPDSLLARFAGQFPQVVASGAPITADYEFVTPAGYRVLCRGVLVPLSKSGSRIDHVCGWISWKSEKAAG